MPTNISGRLTSGGVILPDAATIREVMKSLTERVKKDKALLKRWKSNPRLVLGELGLSRPVQNQILGEEGLRVTRRPGETDAEGGCYSCSGCCMTGCAVSGIG